MQMTRSRKLLCWWLTNLCRLVLSATFIFSGTVKLIDPTGVQYKVEDYASAFGTGDRVGPLTALVMALLLALLEFTLGVYLFFGIRRHRTTQFLFLFMSLMTALTLYLAVENPITNCGCFGDALVLTNWQTFWKNVVLLGMSLAVMLGYRRMTRFITERNQWLVSLYSLVFALAFAFYNLYALPVVDFRPYRVGLDIYKGVMDERYGTDMSMRYIDLSMQDEQYNDITEQWLSAKGYKFLLVAPFLDKADDSNSDRINDLYEFAVAKGYPFLCLTSSMSKDVERWRDNTGAEYPFALTDGTVLKTMIRSNPGLIVLKGGRIIRKYANTQLPDLQGENANVQSAMLSEPSEHSYLRAMLRLLLLFVVPLAFFSLADRIWVGSKYYRRYRNRKRINITNQLNNYNNEKKDCSR